MELGGAVGGGDAGGLDGEAFVLGVGGVVGGAAVVADDAEHRLAVGVEALERADLGGDFGGGGVGDAGHDGGEGSAEGVAAGES